jgi:probable O-glycosylation ligase (exosortase A-associated)
MFKLLLLFLIVLAYGLYAALAIGPTYGFYLYQLIYFMNPNDRYWVGPLSNISFSFISVVFMFGSFIIYNKKCQINKLSNIPEAKWIVAMAVYYILVTLVAIDPALHRTYLASYLKLLLIMYIAFRVIDTRQKLEYALLVYILGSAYIGYEAFSAGRNDVGRIGNIGTVDAPGENSIAASMIPAIPLLLYFIWLKPLKIKLILAVFAVFIINGMILINSRGAMIGAGAGTCYFFFYMIFSRFKLPKQRLMVIVLSSLMVITVIRFADDLFLDRMDSIESEAEVDENADGEGRMNFWLKTFDMLEDHPLGMGIWGYQLVSPQYLSTTQLNAAKSEGLSLRAVHSMWFQGLSELGWIGFSFFILLLISMYRRMKLTIKDALNKKDLEVYYLIIALQASMLCFMGAGSFIDAFRLEVFYWLILFIICACNLSLNNSPSDIKNSLTIKRKR